MWSQCISTALNTWHMLLFIILCLRWVYNFLIMLDTLLIMTHYVSVVWFLSKTCTDFSLSVPKLQSFFHSAWNLVPFCFPSSDIPCHGTSLFTSFLRHWILLISYLVILESAVLHFFCCFFIAVYICSLPEEVLFTRLVHRTKVDVSSFALAPALQQ